MKFPGNRVRLATVRETGKLYIVHSMRFPNGGIGTVYCLNEVSQYHGLRFRTAGPLQSFTRDEVDVKETKLDIQLLRKLLRQYLRRKKDEGFDVTIALTNKGNIRYTMTDGKCRYTVE